MRLWVFEFRGGNEFSVRVPNNPTVNHDGSLTVAHLVLAEKDAAKIQAHAEHHGVRVRRFSEGQTEEQAEERQLLLAVQRGEVDFRCSHCPNCFWLDIQVPRYCGFDGWPDETCEEALRSHKKAQSDLAACPVWGLMGGEEGPFEG